MTILGNRGGELLALACIGLLVTGSVASDGSSPPPTGMTGSVSSTALGLGGSLPGSSAVAPTSGSDANGLGGATRPQLAGDYLRQWPQWRGPVGTGVAPHGEPPVRFGAQSNVRWKTRIPGRGFSSPLVWGDSVFVTTAVPVESEERSPPESLRRRRTRLLPHSFEVLSIDRRTGDVLWRRVATVAKPHERHHPGMSSYANPSPVTDGEAIYASFGSRGLHAYDMAGEHLWSRDFGVEMEVFNRFGEASSPALSGETLVLLFDHEQQSFIEAVDKRTGVTRWKRLRDESTTWSSPTIVEYGGRSQVVVSAGNFVTGYDLETGGLLWKSAGMTPHPVPTPVVGLGLVFAVSGTTERRIQAIRLGHGGDLTGTDAIAWRRDHAASYNPSPLLWDRELYVIRDGGLHAGTSRISMFDALTGEPHYLEQRLPGAYTIKASPVGAANRIYLASQEGDVLVLRRGRRLEILEINSLGEMLLASPAVVGGEIFLRSRDHLFCIAVD